MEVKTILLVDDDPDILAMGELSLGQVGSYQVTTIDSGAAALEIAQREPPDLILMDVHMPGMDGPDTLRALRASAYGKAIPVIFLTGSADPSKWQQYVDLGAAAVLAKPFDPMALPAELSRVLAAL